MAPPRLAPISPVCVEWIEPADVHVTGLFTLGRRVAISYLTNARFFANIPLAATGATNVQATSTKGALSFRFGWKPTVMNSDESITLRRGDSLLLQFPLAVAVMAGTMVPYRFPKPGEFSIVARDAAGLTVATLQVRVASALVPKTTIAELNLNTAIAPCRRI